MKQASVSTDMLLSYPSFLWIHFTCVNTNNDAAADNLIVFFAPNNNSIQPSGPLAEPASSLDFKGLNCSLRFILNISFLPKPRVSGLR